jgi:hypothetical protein
VEKIEPRHSNKRLKDAWCGEQCYSIASSTKFTSTWGSSTVLLLIVPNSMSTSNRFGFERRTKTCSREPDWLVKLVSRTLILWAHLVKVV